jgi:radical SAM family uncharacterized protein/radical SAM-linked protein
MEGLRDLYFKNRLWDTLDKEILPFVIKPGRYVGNELNSIHKPHEPGLLKFALCFPEMYEIGMSYVGMQILYNIINARSDALAERAFSIWPDMEKRMRQKGIPLFSLESATPLSNFDVLGFHFTYEMTFTTVLNMLDLSGIPLLSRERRDSDPLVLAGGPSVMNPEPMADFIDAFFIGDAEEAIQEILDAIRNARTQGLSREETLLKLAQISGIYVPSLYDASYDESGKYKGLSKSHPDVPDKIKVRSVSVLKPEYYSNRPLLPFIEISHDHLSVEIMRGCVRGCRFCQAGYQYRPRRQRPPDEVAEQVLRGIRETGYEDVTLLSLSSTDYDHLGELLEKISPNLAEQRVSLGLPSLRPETISGAVLDLLSSARKTGMTLAPEAGTERLRNTVGKKISDADIFAAFEKALESGWQTFKLYFMIGLPTETDEDIEGIITLLRRLSYVVRQGKGRNINVALSPFNPKSHTPWQWECIAGRDALQKKVDKICAGVKKHNITIKFRNFDLSLIEGVIGRGDRRIGPAIKKAFERGSRLDAWSEWFDPEKWYSAFAEAGIDPGHYTRQIDMEAPLPWDHIEKGISKDFLKKDNLDSKEGVAPLTALERKKFEKPIVALAADDGFGRRPRRITKQTTPAGTYKVRINYARGPQLRFLSHLDTIRSLYRAFRRAELPLSFTEGYHPHVKVSFAQPLPLGYTSEAEYLDLQLSQPYREEYISRLAAVMPAGLSIRAHKHFFANVSSLSKQLNMARYEVPKIGEIEYDDRKLQAVAREKSLVVVRSKEGIERQIDAGRFLQDIILHDDRLIIDVWQIPEGHIKPEEILIFGLGIDPELVKPLMVHRKSQFHISGMRLIEPMDLV